MKFAAGLERSLNEFRWDQKLNIKTTGRDDSHADNTHHPYEPTPYSVLQRLAESGYINKSDKVVDYGCGKGRVGFFLENEIGCKVTGIEFDRHIYKQAIKNLESFRRSADIEFLCENAEKYKPDEQNVFFFFNPFSVSLLQIVIGQIISSFYENPRNMKLFFYYPSDAYISYLMSVDELNFADEIDCSDLFDTNKQRERIVVFEIDEWGAEL